MHFSASPLSGPDASYSLGSEHFPARACQPQTAGAAGYGGRMGVQRPGAPAPAEPQTVDPCAAPVQLSPAWHPQPPSPIASSADLVHRPLGMAMGIHIPLPAVWSTVYVLDPSADGYGPAKR
ncbi:hypothetical protein BP5796_05312 [Coleophoma crateriformis]|uniref:Uncharacterized protein n=1 Tax=Coleophoma crateriformis TaxID=565419 RepID=A0A3D8S3G8_9HELO|nr:hypothetical protein BP5796_05312 [Coleophoma crateriformis]